MAKSKVLCVPVGSAEDASFIKEATKFFDKKLPANWREYFTLELTNTVFQVYLTKYKLSYIRKERGENIITPKVLSALDSMAFKIQTIEETNKKFNDKEVYKNTFYKMIEPLLLKYDGVLGWYCKDYSAHIYFTTDNVKVQICRDGSIVITTGTVMVNNPDDAKKYYENWAVPYATAQAEAAKIVSELPKEFFE